MATGGYWPAQMFERPLIGASWLIYCWITGNILLRICDRFLVFRLLK